MFPCQVSLHWNHRLIIYILLNEFHAWKFWIFTVFPCPVSLHWNHSSSYYETRFPAATPRWGKTNISIINGEFHCLRANSYLLNGAVSNVTSKVWWMVTTYWKKVQGSGRGLVWVPFGICLNGPAKTTEKVKQDIRRLRRGSNLISPEYKYRILPLQRTARSDSPETCCHKMWCSDTTYVDKRWKWRVLSFMWVCR